MTTLIRSARVLDLDGTGAEHAMYSSEANEDDEAPRTRLMLDRTTHDDLGAPAQITVTIEPGNQLGP